MYPCIDWCTWFNWFSMVSAAIVLAENGTRRSPIVGERSSRGWENLICTDRLFILYIRLNVTTSSHWLLCVLNVIARGQTPRLEWATARWPFIFNFRTISSHRLSRPHLSQRRPRAFLSKSSLTMNIFLALSVMRVYMHVNMVWKWKSKKADEKLFLNSLWKKLWE